MKEPIVLRLKTIYFFIHLHLNRRIIWPSPLGWFLFFSFVFGIRISLTSTGVDQIFTRSIANVNDPLCRRCSLLRESESLLKEDDTYTYISIETIVSLPIPFLRSMFTQVISNFHTFLKLSYLQSSSLFTFSWSIWSSFYVDIDSK